MNVKKLVMTALLIAMSAVGGFIKIPSPTGTVAFDSLPGYLAAALLGGWGGAVVGAFGHLISAWTVSFPLSFPLHMLVALQMAVFVSVFGYLFRKGQRVLAVAVAVFLNGVVAPAMLIPILGTGIFAALLIPLLIGSAINIVLAVILAQSKAIQKAGKGLGY
ncbi:MAG: ECF transporter S component [Bacillota bacterium]|nr:ECF transporter S component [Bacillota bacterium]